MRLEFFRQGLTYSVIDFYTPLTENIAVPLRLLLTFQWNAAGKYRWENGSSVSPPPQNKKQIFQNSEYFLSYLTVLRLSPRGHTYYSPKHKPYTSDWNWSSIVLWTWAVNFSRKMFHLGNKQQSDLLNEVVELAPNTNLLWRQFGKLSKSAHCVLESALRDISKFHI